MEVILTQKHSIYGKISFISFIGWLVFLVIRIVGFTVSNYSFYKKAPALDTLSTLVNIILILFGAISFIVGLISVFEKDTKKIFPIISVSITSFMLFLIVLMLIQQASLVYYVEKGIVTNYGIFEIPTVTNSDNSITYLYEQRYLKNNTEDIPASKGIRFGFHYVISGEPDDETIPVMKITRYPEPGIRRNNRTVLSDTSYFSVTMNKLRYSGYLFEHDYELISGKWEFEIWYKGKKLLSKKFNVFYQL